MLRAGLISFFTFVAVAWTFVAPSVALAEKEPSPDVPTLVRALDEDLAALDTSDCAAACNALASMIRSAERICELDPGPPCAEARDKVEAARDKVRQACPDCEVAKRDTRTLTEDQSEVDVQVNGDDPVAEAPGSGGCASCAVGGDGSNTALIALLLGGFLLGLRRRR